MANINELMNGWGFGKQAAIGTGQSGGGDVASHEPQYQTLGQGSGERG